MIRKWYNARVKYAKDKAGNLHPYELLAFNFAAFGPDDLLTPISNNRSESAFSDFPESPLPSPEGGNAPTCQRDFLSESQRRAVRRCRDIGTCNPDLDIFVTLTLDREKIDRYDYAQIIRVLNVWLDNRVRRNGLKYLIVPELHKDGAIHFHGLFNDVLDRRPAGVKHHGKWVYNLPDWTLGFTTAQRVTGPDCSRKVAEYVLKYITKSAGKIGGRFYLHGGRLDEPAIVWYDIPIDAIPGKPFEVAPGVEVISSRNELTISDLTTRYGESGGTSILKPILSRMKSGKPFMPG